MTIQTDDFDRADAADLGANWTHLSTGSGNNDLPYYTKNNAASVHPVGNSDAFELRNMTVGNAQFSEAELLTFDGNQPAVAIRMSAGFAVESLYAQPGGGWIVYRAFGGSFSFIASGSGLSIGQRIRLSVDATENFTVWADGTPLDDFVDNVVASGGVGLGGFFFASAEAQYWDNWRGGDGDGSASGVDETPPAAVTVTRAPDPTVLAGGGAVTPPAAVTVTAARDPVVVSGAAVFPSPARTTTRAPTPLIGEVVVPPAQGGGGSSGSWKPNRKRLKGKTTLDWTPDPPKPKPIVRMQPVKATASRSTSRAPDPQVSTGVSITPTVAISRTAANDPLIYAVEFLPLSAEDEWTLLAILDFEKRRRA